MTNVFKQFEIKVIRLLAEPELGADLVNGLIATGRESGCEHTGVGYFLRVDHPGLPNERKVLSSPLVVGAADGFDVGFVVFIENGTLTLECHGWGGSVPEDLRDREVVISIARTS